MRPANDSLDWAGSELRDRLEAFADGRSDGDTPLPWADRLPPRDRDRLREELAMVLSEPETTGEPVDWLEIDHILQEWAEVARWDGALVQEIVPSTEAAYSVAFRPRDARALAMAAAAV